MCYGTFWFPLPLNANTYDSVGDELRYLEDRHCGLFFLFIGNLNLFTQIPFVETVVGLCKCDCSTSALQAILSPYETVGRRLG